MNEAQKFLLNNECDDLRLKDAQKVEDWIYVSDMMERYHKEQVKKLTIPVVMQSCDTCKHLSTCRFWQEAPNNGATCKFYIEHIT